MGSEPRASDMLYHGAVTAPFFDFSGRVFEKLFQTYDPLASASPAVGVMGLLVSASTPG